MIQSPLRRRRLVPPPPPPPVVLALALATTLVVSLQTGAHAIKLTTTSRGSKNSGLQNFVARPIHWPEIVLSSNRVEVLKKDTRPQQKPPPGAALASFFVPRNGAGDETDASSSPATTAGAAREALAVGDTVVEYFALNQFEVEWTCTQNDPGRLVVVSPNGVPGIASDCVMDFEFVNNNNNNNGGDDKNGDTNENEDRWAVKLTMEYTPQSPLAVLATPALVVDNWLALNVLLPSATDTAPLDSFRKLMGVLYGVAGLAHLADLLAGGSRLFTEVAGIPSFWELDPSGRLCALFWCAAGPIAYLLSAEGPSPPGTGERGGGVAAPGKAEAGLVLYGITEVVGALLASGVPGAAPGVVANAVGVQAVVLAAWVYSYQKEQQQRVKQRQQYQ